MPFQAEAQDSRESESSGSSYQLLPAPDVWYNSVDGIRLGVRVLGQAPNTFGDGPHRLNAGFWLGTKFPGNPLSYYLKFTEPIPGISDFGSEASISIETSYRTGFQEHGLSFDKRWQTGFNEMNYKELSVAMRAEHRFDKDYLLYEQLWQDQWLYIASATFDYTDENGLGRYQLSWSADANIAGQAESFIRSRISYQQQAEISNSFTLFGRFYTGLASDNTAPEYLFARSYRSPRYWMNQGLTRARGTIPPNWMEKGNIQVTGGAGLRGYLGQDTDALNVGSAPLYTSLSAINLELDYPNPIDKAISDIPVLGGFVDLRSYLFFDSGTSLGITSLEEDRTLADAGLGFLFSIDVPDYLGKSRGVAIRYDIPLWLSHPGTEKSFKFRNVIGIGAIISL
jgi:hypothetical protein